MPSWIAGDRIGSVACPDARRQSDHEVPILLFERKVLSVDEQERRTNEGDDTKHNQATRRGGYE